MLTEIYQHLITTCIGLGILASGYLCHLLTGVARVAFTPELKWSWKKMLEGLVKAGLWGVAILLWVVVCDGVNWFAKRMGADIEAILDGASVAGLVGGLIGGTVYYVGKSFKNIIDFVNTNHTEVKVNNPDYKGVADAVSNILGALFVHDDGDGEEHTEATGEFGTWPYYKVDVSTPDKFYNAVNGKSFNEGWGAQCVAGFKEFCYSLAGKTVNTLAGAAKDYANQGSQICALGFTRLTDRKLQNGDWVIFGMGKYGHVTMYYNGRFFGQNQSGNGSGYPFNLVGISLDTYLCHYRPNIYIAKPAPKPTPTPAPTPKPTPKPTPAPSSVIKAGDSVIAWGQGTATSLGTGAKTKNFKQTKMKVIMVVNGRYALNQYNKGSVGNAAAVTGWWPKSQISK